MLIARFRVHMRVNMHVLLRSGDSGSDHEGRATDNVVSRPHGRRENLENPRWHGFDDDSIQAVDQLVADVARYAHVQRPCRGVRQNVRELVLRLEIRIHESTHADEGI